MVRGGKRKGAGRKAVNRKKVTIALRVEPEIKENLMLYAKDCNTTVSAIIEGIIKDFMLSLNSALCT